MSRVSWRTFRASIVTGASDTDPSAIVTCTQAGASAGFSLLWLMPLTTALLIWLDRLAVRIGFERQEALSILARYRVGTPLAALLGLMLVVNNEILLGADIAGVANLLADLTGLPYPVTTLACVAFPAALLVGGSFAAVRRVLFLLTPLYALYIFAAIVARPSLSSVAGGFLPSVPGSTAELLTIVGVVGAILTPYVFIWQAEDAKQLARRHPGMDEPGHGAAVGMVYANIVLFAVMVASAAAIHRSGDSGLQLESMRQAADALEPLLGGGAFVIFTIATLASALIATPVIVAVIGFTVAQTRGKRYGLNWPVSAAKEFYGVCLIALAGAGGFALLEVDPVGPLFWAQFISGIVLVPLAVLLVIESRRRP